jgi:hypothetical protein
MLRYRSGRAGLEATRGNDPSTHPVSDAIFSNDWLRRLALFSLATLAGVKAKRLKALTI